MVPLVVPMVTVLLVMQRVMVPSVLEMVGLLQGTPRFLEIVMGTCTRQDRSLDCWKIPAKCTASRTGSGQEGLHLRSVRPWYFMNSHILGSEGLRRD